jgi:cbb3-type cytochrome oxidase subunit 3
MSEYFFGILSPFKTVQAQTSSVNITDGLGEIQQQTQLSSNLPQIIGNIVRVVFGLLGIILFLLFFYAGFIWMTARGNDEQVDKAKRIIKNAIIGTVVVLLSYALSQGILYLLGVGRNNTGGLFGGSGADVTQGNFDGSGALGGGQAISTGHYIPRDCQKYRSKYYNCHASGKVFGERRRRLPRSAECTQASPRRLQTRITRCC